MPSLKNIPKSALYAGGVVGVGLGIYVYVKHKSNKNTAASTVAGQPGYGYGYGGYGYSNPPIGGAATTPYEYGYGQYGYGYYGYGGEFAGLGGYGSSTPPYAAPSVATTNAGWAQAAESYLSGTGGANAVTVGDALGKYITGQSLTANQQSLVEEAIAFEGYPPVPGANNYPPNMHSVGTTGQGGTTGAGTKTVEADGKQDLSQFAHAHNTTGGKLIALKGNKWLVSYYGTKRKIGKGAKIQVPG